jgi:preprotein translocase subunit SecG
MMSFVITVHVIACIFLITVVLIQRGRGGGFVSNLSGLETMFGTKTSAFLTKATTVSAVAFFITCLLLAVLSVNRSKSLLQGYKSAPITTQKSPAAPGQAEPAAPVETAPAAPAEAGPAVVQPAVTQPAVTPSDAAQPVTTKTQNAPPLRQGELK